MSYYDNVNFSHLMKIISASFLHCKLYLLEGGERIKEFVSLSPGLGSFLTSSAAQYSAEDLRGILFNFYSIVLSTSLLPSV